MKEVQPINQLAQDRREFAHLQFVPTTEEVVIFDGQTIALNQQMVIYRQLSQKAVEQYVDVKTNYGREKL